MVDIKPGRCDSNSQAQYTPYCSGHKQTKRDMCDDEDTSNRQTRGTSRIADPPRKGNREGIKDGRSQCPFPAQGSGKEDIPPGRERCVGCLA